MPSARHRPPVSLTSGAPPAMSHDLDPFFVFDFHAVDGPGDSGQRWSSYWDVERLCRGPEPVPDWVVTDRAAIDTDLGVLKTGKEADVFLVERGVDGHPDKAVVMAAKRYRTEEHRSFQRSDTYTEGRRTRNSRDTRAMAKKTEHGRAVASGQWAGAEWESLKRFWSAGVPVPYPVQIDGDELHQNLGAVDLHGVGNRIPADQNLLSDSHSAPAH